MAARRRIHLIATGGTIAGTASDPTDTRSYTAGVLTAEQLLASVPTIGELADITVEQLYSLDSKDMTPEQWLGLARATQAALDRREVDGVVITHGTDTMEESAFFLDLVLPPGKPVVFTGAMRPATALSADGPMNLYGAVSLAASEEAHGLGVVVAMSDRIHAARDVIKADPDDSDAFSSGLAGLVGRLAPVVVSRCPERAAAPVDISRVERLPRVDMLLLGAGSAPDLLNACLSAGTRGVVLALPGNAALPDQWQTAIRTAGSSGVAVVGAARTGAARGRLLRAAGAEIPISTLSPPKVRVALMVALAAGCRWDPLLWVTRSE